MKARLTIAAALLLPLGLVAMPTAVEYLPAGAVTLKQPVKLGDGSVLPSGPYDVQIHYKGFGNLAEFHFFQGGVFKGKTNAEARGFRSQAPPVSTARKAGEGQKDYVKYDVKGEKLDTEQKSVKLTAAQAIDTHIKRVDGESTEKDHGGDLAIGSPAFSWRAHGLDPGVRGKTVPHGEGLKLSFDSANSAAGFNAILPFVEKKKK